MDSVNIDVEEKIVFIDTEVFVSKCFNFSDKHFQSFIKYCEDRIIKFVLVDITQKEIISRISRDLPKAKEIFLEALKKEKNNIFLRSYNFRQRIKPKIDEIQKDYIKQFEDFIIKSNCEVYSSSMVEVKKLNEMYFNQEPPFGKKISKKDEFPDAIMCLTLKFFAEKYKVPIYIISGDGGFLDFSNATVGFNHFPSIEKFLNMINKENGIYKRIESYIKENFNCIKKSLEHHIEDNAFYYSGDEFIDGELSEFRIIKIEVADSNIYDLTEETATITINWKVKLDFTVNYVPHEAIIYDKEDKETHYMERRDTSLIEYFTVVANIELDIDDEGNFEMLNTDFSDIDPSVSEPTDEYSY